MPGQKQFRVSGEDEDGAIWAYETDDEEAARETFQHMKEDLCNVEFAEAQLRD